MKRIILFLPLAITGCTLFGLDFGKKSMPPRPLETPAYRELLRETTDMQRQAAELFDADGAEPASNSTRANLKIAHAVHSVVGAPIDPMSFAAVAEQGDGVLDQIITSLRAEKTRHVDALAQWESRVDDLRASLSAERAKSGLFGRIVDGLTTWVRWIGFVVVLLAGLALAAKTYLKSANWYVASAIAAGGLAAAIAWLFVVAFIVKVALWIVGIGVVGLAAYGVYEAVQHGRKSAYLDSTITAVETIRKKNKSAVSKQEIDDALKENEVNGQDGYVRARKNALSLRE